MRETNKIAKSKKTASAVFPVMKYIVEETNSKIIIKGS
jgi:hypothetical protein